MPRVSVLLPVHNGAATLGRALESLSDQRFRDFEVLILDDGSDDETLNIARRAARREPRLDVRALPRAGLVATLNAGLELARGRYLARMDADDLCHPDRLAAQAALLDARPGLGLVSCLVAFGGDRDAAGGYARHVDFVNSLRTHRSMALHRFRESPLAHPSVMFRADAAREHGAYRDGDFPEDYELWLRWFDAGVRFAKVRRELVSWSDSPNRLSRVDERYAVRRFHEIKAPYLARHLARTNPRHPEVVLFGAGRESRKRAELLEAEGVAITAYVDVDPRKIGRVVHGRPVLHRDDLPRAGSCFGLSYLAGHGSAEDLVRFLAGRGWVMGRHYLLCA